MNRRHFLGVISVIGATGCISSSENESINIAELKLLNFDDIPHTVQIIVENETEILLWKTLDIPAASHGDVTRAEFKYVSNLPKNPGRYSVYVRVDESESIASLKATELHEEIECSNLEAEIDTEGEVELLYTVGCS